MAAIEDTVDTSLRALVIVESDSGGSTFITWSYPSLSPILTKIITKRTSPSPPSPTFSKYKDNWIYISSSPGSGRVESFSLAIVTDQFNPEKFFALLSLMATEYASSLSPVPLLRCYLDVYTDSNAKIEQVEAEPLTFSSQTFDSSRSHLLVESLLDLSRSFADSLWLLWSALLMKKRIVVLSSDVSALQSFIRALPLFVLHRQDWSLLRPFVNLDVQEEVEDLESAGVYVAGFTDVHIRQKEYLFDVLVDLDSQTIQPSKQATDDFIETPFHTDFSSFLKQALTNETISHQKIVKAFKVKNTALFAKLESLKVSEGDAPAAISYASFAAQELPSHVERFLYAVASAEGMTNVGGSRSN
eukprot:TRINITY_DN1083_c0_g1_i2.p1 TRINITY_DN1083_c0_g1~~TRINITY_DN1083_c0_g1_i2.p1  ORF type:complete len:381 (+),score=110.91 TRINITY_DN1083_c0_g1_i2:68-1144(+)